MLRLIIFLVVATALAVVAVWLADQPGSVTLRWGEYEAVTSVGVTAVLLLAFALAVTVVIEVYRWLRGLPRRVRRNREHRREVRGYESITRGLLAAAGGDRAAAQWHSRQAAKLAPDRPGALLLAAQTAQLDGRDDEAARVFRAMVEVPDTELLGLRGLLAQAVRAGDRNEALDLARRAYARSPRAPWVLQTLFELLVRDRKWAEAQPVLDGMGREKLLGERVLHRRRAILLHMLAEQEREQGRTAEGLTLARRATRLAPDFAPAAIAASGLATACGKSREARKLLEASWRVAPQPEVAAAWLALQPSENPTRLYERLRALEKLRADSPQAQVVLGEAAVAAHRYDEARIHLERGLTLGPTAALYRALANLEDAAGEPDKARDWRSRVAEAPPDKTWVCEDTGEIMPAWAPFGASGAFDVVHWSEPPRLTRLIAYDQSLSTIVEGGAPVPPPRPLPRAPAPDMSTAAVTE
ncbi:MAG TPA: heme biosynthesis HemY N-terminal domain-containing protein [Geminicoccaceae bacterium]|nr:heme biosynthesis HemY N-terminal domain-containing protein [Geminicoccus sp.]HMU50096.1 heme biosynthesis HemY N-terminal domain-containing protein [Geminicoccaceae bacterium]